MIQQIMSDLYKLEIPLPGNPLKTLNSYIIVGESRSLIIDTGFDMPECLDALLSGINELGLDRTKLDVLSTHFHADHTGLISQIISDTSEVYMSGVDSEMFKEVSNEDSKYWDVLIEKYLVEGYPSYRLVEVMRVHPAKIFMGDSKFDITTLEDGDELSYGNFNFNVIITPGHTPGHLCLYEPKHKILFTGDHLLFDISPNITWWYNVEDSLNSYLTSLNKISLLDVETVLPGHRGNQGVLRDRALDLRVHHNERLYEILEIVSEEPCLTSYEIASKLTWKTNVEWAELPPMQRWFAVGETISHVEYLTNLGKLEKYKSRGMNNYFVQRRIMLSGG